MLLDFGELLGVLGVWGRRGDLHFNGKLAVIEYQNHAQILYVVRKNKVYADAK